MRATIGLQRPLPERVLVLYVQRNRSTLYAVYDIAAICACFRAKSHHYTIQYEKEKKKRSNNALPVSYASCSPRCQSSCTCTPSHPLDQQLKSHHPAARSRTPHCRTHWPHTVRYQAPEGGSAQHHSTQGIPLHSSARPSRNLQGTQACRCLSCCPKRLRRTGPLPRTAGSTASRRW